MTSSTQTRRHAAIRARSTDAHKAGLIKGWSVATTHGRLTWTLRDYAVLSTSQTEEWLTINRSLINHRLGDI